MHFPELRRRSPRRRSGWRWGLMSSLAWIVLQGCQPADPRREVSPRTVPDAAAPAAAVPPERAPEVRVPAPATRPRAGVVLQGDVNASRTGTNLAEVSIAADRFLPDRVVAAAIDVTTGEILTMSSGDGGRTWSLAAIPKHPGARFHADPMVAFDSRGVVHLVHIPVANQNLGIEVNRSLDGGRTWTPSLRLSSLPDDDKTIILADDGSDSPFRDRVYVAWKLSPGGVIFSRSDDGGASFSAPQRISSAGVSGLDLAVDAQGGVFLVANSGRAGGILLFRSLDGGSTFEPFRRVAPVRAGFYTTTPSVCTRKSLVHASIGIDRSRGADRGNLYVAWNDYPPGVTGCSGPCDPATRCTSDVFLSRSTDRGITWSAPIRVHESDLGSSDQYHHWVGVDPRDGRIYVAYKDTRDDPQRLATHVFLSASIDGGLSFEPSLRLSSAAGRSTTSFQYGDYQGLWAGDGTVYAAWADFRASTRAGQIYVARADFEADAPPSPEGTLSFESGRYQATEPGGEAAVTVRLTGSAAPVAVRYRTADGTAAAAADYQATAGTLRWAEGENGPRTFTVPVFDDAEPEGIETFRVLLEDAEGAQVGEPAVAEVEVIDDDGLPCSTEDQALCLLGGRFRVEVDWRDFEDRAGSGTVVPAGSDNSGLFWFFEDTNWEMLVKVLDGCGFNGYFWVFSAATTNVEYALTVTDTVTGLTRRYGNALGAPASAITDVEAFATCAYGP